MEVEVVGSGTWRFCFLRGRLCGAMPILMAVAWAQASPMSALLYFKQLNNGRRSNDVNPLKTGAGAVS